MKTKCLVWCVLMLWSSVAWATTLTSQGEFYVKPTHPNDVAQYEYKWGTSTGVYTGNAVVADNTDLVYTFAEAGLQNGTTYFAVVETTLANGQVGVSDEIMFEVRDSFGNQFCIRGMFNGQPVDLCVPVTLQPAP